MILYDDLIEQEYILPLDDEYLGKLLDSHCVRRVEVQSKCTVEICKRILTRYLGTFGWAKYFIIKISGPNESALHMCNKLLEKINPRYLLRKEYSTASIHMFIDETTPDNNQVIGSQRTGANLDTYEGLTLQSYYNTQIRYPGKRRKAIAPWQVFSSQANGIYYPSHEGTTKIFSYVYPNFIAHQKAIDTSVIRSKRHPKIQNSKSASEFQNSSSFNESKTNAGKNNLLGQMSFASPEISENASQKLSKDSSLKISASLKSSEDQRSHDHDKIQKLQYENEILQYEKLMGEKTIIRKESNEINLQLPKNDDSNIFTIVPNEEPLMGEISLTKVPVADESTDVSIIIEDHNKSQKNTDLSDKYEFKSSLKDNEFSNFQNLQIGNVKPKTRHTNEIFRSKTESDINLARFYDDD